MCVYIYRMVNLIKILKEERFKMFKNFIVALMAIFSSACASIISGSHYDVAIKSEPSGAHFEIRDENGVLQQSGTTPSVVDLKSGTAYFHKKNYSVNYSLDGYENEI